MGGKDEAVRVGRDMVWLDSLMRAPTKAENDEDPSTLDRYSESLSVFEAHCRTQNGSEKPDLLQEVLLDERSRVGGTERLDYATLAASGILLRGITGVDQLISIAKSSARSMWKRHAVEVLWRAARGLEIPDPHFLLYKKLYLKYPISEETRRAARAALDDLIIEAQEDPRIFELLLGVAHLDAMDSAASPTAHETPTDDRFARHFIRVLGDASISLTGRVLSEFEEMVAQSLPEERYQSFLKRHPVILDPLSAETVPKHKLGIEFVTDFVVRRHDYRYVVVEIEKPQDPIVTASGNFSAQFTHAMGQVLDFQGWVASNVAYAQKHLPEIENPHGLLIIGRRSDMTAPQVEKLRRWCANSKAIEVVTFDDLVTRGRQLLKSLRSHVDQ